MYVCVRVCVLFGCVCGVVWCGVFGVVAYVVCECGLCVCGVRLVWCVGVCVCVCVCVWFDILNMAEIYFVEF